MNNCSSQDHHAALTYESQAGYKTGGFQKSGLLRMLDQKLDGLCRMPRRGRASFVHSKTKDWAISIARIGSKRERGGTAARVG